MCPYHGKEPQDDEDDPDEFTEEDPEEESPETRPRTPVRQPAPIAPKQGIAAAEQVVVNDMVPVVAARKTDKSFQAEAEVGFHVPRTIPITPAIGVPMRGAPANINVPGWLFTNPLFIPDDKVEEATPPGMAKAGRSVGPASEEAFTQMLQQYPSRATETIAGSEAEDANRQGNSSFANLSFLFAGLFTANAVAHIWQTYNARVTGVARPGRIHYSKGPSYPSQPSKQPARSRPFPRPVRAPARVPVGAGRGGYGGLHFQSNPGNPRPPLPQERWDADYRGAINTSGFLDID